jgi:hypothetical protein
MKKEIEMKRVKVFGIQGKHCSSRSCEREIEVEDSFCLPKKTGQRVPVTQFRADMPGQFFFVPQERDERGCPGDWVTW